MKDFIISLVAPLVDHPDHVSIETIERSHETVYQLSVHPDDMGKIIGKQGRIAKALRTVVQSAAMRKKEKVYLEIR